MKFVIVVVAFGYLAITDSAPSLPIRHPGGIGGIFKGPNSETIIKGPDGSVITSAAEGAAVKVAPNKPIFVAEPEVIVSPVSPTVAAIAQPISEIAPPLVATPVITANVVAEPVATIVKTGDVHTIDAEIVDAPVIEPKQNSDLIGPSGSISTRGSSSIVSGPSSTTISGPAVVGTPIVGTVLEPLGIPVAAPIDSVPIATPIESVSTNLAAPVIPIPNSVTLEPQVSISSTILPPPAISTHGSLTVAGPVVQSTGSQGVLPTLGTPIDLGVSVATSTTLAPPVSSTGIGQLSTLPTQANLISSTVAPIQKIGIDQLAVEKQLQEEQAVLNQRRLEQELLNRQIEESAVANAQLANKAALQQQLQSQAAATVNSQLQIQLQNRQIQANQGLIQQGIVTHSGQGLTELSGRTPVLFEPSGRSLSAPATLPDGRELGLSSAATISPNPTSLRSLVGTTSINNGVALGNGEGLIASDGSLLAAGAINGIPKSAAIAPQPQPSLSIEDHPLLASALRSDGLDISKLKLTPVQLSPPGVIPASIDINSVQTSGWGRIGRDIKKDKEKQ